RGPAPPPGGTASVPPPGRARRYGRCRIGRGRGRPPPACRSRQKSTWDGRSYNGAGLLRGRLGRGVRSAVRGDSLQLRVEGPRPLLLREMVEASLGVRRPPPGGRRADLGVLQPAPRCLRGDSPDLRRPDLQRRRGQELPAASAVLRS